MCVVELLEDVHKRDDKLRATGESFHNNELREVWLAFKEVNTCVRTALVVLSYLALCTGVYYCAHYFVLRCSTVCISVQQCTIMMYYTV